MFRTPGSRARTGGRAFPSGTQLLFINAAAPLGWTRVATFDDAILRIVGSAVPGSGGVNAFSTVNAQTGTGTGNTGTGSTGTGTTGTGTSGATTITTASLPAHTHTVGNQSTALFVVCTGSGVNTATTTGGNTGNGTGTGGSHTHTIPGLSVPALSVPSLSVPSLSVSFSIKYVDALIARKN